MLSLSLACFFLFPRKGHRTGQILSVWLRPGQGVLGALADPGMEGVALTGTGPGHAYPAVGAGQPGGCQPPQLPASSPGPPARDQPRL